MTLPPKRRATLILAATLLAAGCINSREGERCDTNAGNRGNDDCASGLICKPTGNSARCCPEAGVATDPSCTSTQSSFIGDAGVTAPFDSGLSEAAVPADAAGQ